MKFIFEVHLKQHPNCPIIVFVFCSSKICFQNLKNRKRWQTRKPLIMLKKQTKPKHYTIQADWCETKTSYIPNRSVVSSCRMQL